MAWRLLLLVVLMMMMMMLMMMLLSLSTELFFPAQTAAKETW